VTAKRHCYMVTRCWSSVLIAPNDFEQLGRIFEHAPGFMAVVEGPDLRFAVANQAFRKLVGRSDLIGKTLTGALPTPRCRT
jgi:PAS domain-containing protein